MPLAEAAMAAQMRSLLHALAQPLAAAGLSAETTLLLFERSNVETVRLRLQRLCDELGAARHLLRCFMRGLQPTIGAIEDVALSSLLQGAGLEAPSAGMMVRADAELVAAALAGLHAALHQPAPAVALAVEPKAVELSLAGPGADTVLTDFWLDVLRRAGLRPRRSIRDGQTRVALRLPLMVRP